MGTAVKEETTTSPKTVRREEPEAPREGGGRKYIVIPIVLLLIAAGAWWGYKSWTFSRAHISTDDATVDGDVVPVIAKVSGYVQKVTVDENQTVRPDSFLVQLDRSEYQVKLLQAQAELAEARAAVGGGGVTGQAQAAVESATGQRSSLESDIAAAQATRDKAHSDLTRMTDLAAKQIVSQQQLDAARAAADVADANLQSVQRRAATATAGISNAEAGVRLASARLSAATAAVQDAQLQLSYTKIIAPVGGIVSKKEVEQGQLVQAGQPLMMIVADSGIWITANFKETQLANLRVGEPVDIDVDAYDGATAKGKVESLSGATGAKFALLPPDNATGNFTKIVQRVPVRIAVTQDLGKDRPLRPGMSVTVHVIEH